MTKKKEAGARPRRYDEAFKQEAVRLWKSSGRSAEQTAQELGIKKQYRKMAIRARKTSRAWLFQGAGLIQFAEACEACGMDRQRLLNEMVERSDRLIANPRSSGSVFGREIGPRTPA